MSAQANWYKVPELLALRDRHLPWQSTVTGTKATKAMELAEYLIQNRLAYIEAMASGYSSSGAARFAGYI